MTATSPFTSLYVHIPFCKAKCLYCDFDSSALGGSGCSGTLNDYLDHIDRLIDSAGAAGELDSIRTVYIGGGTPSLAGARLASLVRRVRRLCDPEEFTCEANPESFTPALASDLRAAGVTRISLGVQSLQAEELRAIGRIHSADEALGALDIALSNGFSTSCDLMCGLPCQDLDSWASTLDLLLSHGRGPDHVSVYPLQLEEGTPLAALEARGRVELPDEDFQASCMDLAAKMLHEHGFERYEVASYARKGHACRHNIAYWSGESYLAVGRSGAGMLDGGDAGRTRFVQIDDAGERFDVERLSARQAAAEDLMLACRMSRGIGMRLLDRASLFIPRIEIEAACARAVELGLARWSDGRLVPSHAGWIEGNALYGIFWDLASAQ